MQRVLVTSDAERLPVNAFDTEENVLKNLDVPKLLKAMMYNLVQFKRSRGRGSRSFGIFLILTKLI